MTEICVEAVREYSYGVSSFTQMKKKRLFDAPLPSKRLKKNVNLVLLKLLYVENLDFLRQLLLKCQSLERSPVDELKPKYGNANET